MKKPIVLEGICSVFSEQGIGPHWIFQESEMVFWKLEDGDHLTIFDKRKGKGKKVVWSGFISLWQNRLGRSRQKGISHKKWTRWFQKKYPAKFTPGPNQPKRP